MTFSRVFLNAFDGGDEHESNFHANCECQRRERNAEASFRQYPSGLIKIDRMFSVLKVSRFLFR